MTDPARRTIAELAAEVARLLATRGETLAVAETSAGGQISAALTAIPGCSAWFLGSVIAYSAGSKKAWLDWTAPPEGTVSAAAALSLAEAVRRRAGATWGIAETGVAGTTVSRRSAKPAGLSYVAAVGGDEASVARVAELRAIEERRVDQQVAFAAGSLALLVEALTALEQS